MGIVTVEGCHWKDSDTVQLPVALSGGIITVEAGSFRINGVDYSLLEDQNHDLPAVQDKLISVAGYLVKSKHDDSIGLLVDEVHDDPSDTSYDFESSQDFEMLHYLFHANLIPGAVDPVLEVRVLTDQTPPKPYPLRSKKV